MEQVLFAVKTIAATAMVLMMATVPVQSQISDKDFSTLVIANVTEKYIECGAYFQIVSVGLKRRGTPKDAKFSAIYDGAFEKALIVAVKAAGVIGMTDEVMKIKMQEAGQSMMKAMDHKMVNLSVVRIRYHKPCLFMIEKPAEFLRSYRAEARKKYGR